MQIFFRGHSVSQNRGAPFLQVLYHKLPVISLTSFAFILSIAVTALNLFSWLCLVSQPRSFVVPSELFPHGKARKLCPCITGLLSFSLCLIPGWKYPFPSLHMALPYPLPLVAINSLEHSANGTKDNMEDKATVPFPTVLTGTTLLSPALCRKAACRRNPALYRQGWERSEYECICFSCWCSANHVKRNRLTTGCVKTNTPMFDFTLTFKASELCKHCF